MQNNIEQNNTNTYAGKQQVTFMKYATLLLMLLLGSINTLTGQVSRSSELFLTLKKQDSIFFERSFNRCDLAYLSQAVHKDLMFYHDQGGIQDRTAFLENIRKYICSDSSRKPVRTVVTESLEVFPLYNNGVLYGAIQTGIHDFYIREKNKADLHTSRAKFTHLYLLENGQWLLKEVLSYDHKDPAKNPD